MPAETPNAIIIFWYNLFNDEAFSRQAVLCRLKSFHPFRWKNVFSLFSKTFASVKWTAQSRVALYFWISCALNEDSFYFLF